MKYIYKLTFIVFFSSLANFIAAQSCTTCNQMIIGIDTSSYTVSTGQTLCIDSTAVFKGKVTLNGGTICNNGVFNPSLFVVSSGAIYNYSTFSILNNCTLNSAVNITNNEAAIFSVDFNFIIGGATILNNGIINVGNNCDANSGSLTTNNNILNCVTIVGEQNLINNGVINKR